MREGIKNNLSFTAVFFPTFPNFLHKSEKDVRGRKGSKTFRKPANSHAWLIERFQIVNSQKYRFVPVFVFHLRLFARHAQSFSLEGLSRANETRRGREKNISSIRVYQDFAFLNKREKKIHLSVKRKRSTESN